MKKIKYGFLINTTVAFKNAEGKTIAHAKLNGKTRWFYDPGVGIRQKISKMMLNFQEIDLYGELVLK